MSLPATVTRARLQLMLRHPYLAAAVARLPVVDASEMGWCRTMATDGYYLYVAPSFCEGLSEDEIAFTFAHEVLHCVLGHIDRRGDRDRAAWNVAIDYATNALLVEAGMIIPAALLYRRDFAGMTAEEIYERLAVPAGDRAAASDSGTGEGRNPGGRLGPEFDLHVDPGDLEGMATRAADFPSPEERRQLRMQLSEGVRRQLPGHAAGYLDQEIEKATTSRVPWEHLLARFVAGLRRSDYRLYPFNRRHLWRGFYLPSVGVPGPEHLVVAVDTSGSMDEEVLSRAFGELDRLRAVSDCRLTVLQSDVVIQHEEEFLPYENSHANEPAGERVTAWGRGGTDLRAPFNWLQQKTRTEPAPDALIFITDGFGPMPDSPPDYPVLWIVPEHGVPDVPFGSMIRLPPAE